jgi:xylulokinase
VFGKTVVTMAADEGPGYGVALLAAVGAGEFKDVPEACEATVKTTGQTKPAAAARKAYDRGFPVYQELYRSLREEFKKIAALS